MENDRNLNNDRYVLWWRHNNQTTIISKNKNTRWSWVARTCRTMLSAKVVCNRISASHFFLLFGRPRPEICVRKSLYPSNCSRWSQQRCSEGTVCQSFAGLCRAISVSLWGLTDPRPPPLSERSSYHRQGQEPYGVCWWIRLVTILPWTNFWRRPNPCFQFHTDGV